jgi:hypothetical protein
MRQLLLRVPRIFYVNCRSESPIEVCSVAVAAATPTGASVLLFPFRQRMPAAMTISSNSCVQTQDTEKKHDKNKNKSYMRC